MNYKQLDEKKKVQIDTLLEEGYSMREVGTKLGISHSTISRYRNKVYVKRDIDIHSKYSFFIEYLYENYNFAVRSIEVCTEIFKIDHPDKPSVSTQQVYNWINNGKLKLTKDKLCYKKHKKKRRNGMMNHTYWNVKNKHVLPISLRPKHIEDRDELGHLEIDSIIGKRNEKCSIISIVDRCSRMVWLLKADHRFEHYTNKVVRNFMYRYKIPFRSITMDNGTEFSAMGIVAKEFKVKAYKCDPYCSFQRGTNERMNGLVRRFIPKGVSLKRVTQDNLDFIAYQINNMPRKLFDFDNAFTMQERCV